MIRSAVAYILIWFYIYEVVSDVDAYLGFQTKIENWIDDVDPDREGKYEVLAKFFPELYESGRVTTLYNTSVFSDNPKFSVEENNMSILLCEGLSLLQLMYHFYNMKGNLMRGW